MTDPEGSGPLGSPKEEGWTQQRRKKSRFSLDTSGGSPAEPPLSLGTTPAANTFSNPTYRLFVGLRKFYHELDPEAVDEELLLETAERFVGKEKLLKAAFKKKYDGKELDIPPAPEAVDELKVRISKFLSAFEPEKLSHAQALAQRYCGKSKAIIHALEKKYGVLEKDIELAIKEKKEEKGLEESSAASTLTGDTSTSDADDDDDDDDDVGSISSGLEEEDLEPLSLADRLKPFYEKYDPGKVGDIDRLAKKYEMKQEGLYDALNSKYGAAPITAEESLRQIKMERKRERQTARRAEILAKRREERERRREEKRAAKKRTKKRRGSKGGESSLDSPRGRTISRAKSEFPGEVDLTQASCLKERLAPFYEKHNPEKLPLLDKICGLYAHKEAALFNALLEKYGERPMSASEEVLGMEQAGSNPVSPDDNQAAPSDAEEEEEEEEVDLDAEGDDEGEDEEVDLDEDVGTPVEESFSDVFGSMSDIDLEEFEAELSSDSEDDDDDNSLHDDEDDDGDIADLWSNPNSPMNSPRRSTSVIHFPHLNHRAAPPLRRQRRMTVMLPDDHLQKMDHRSRMLNFLRVHDPPRMKEVDRSFILRVIESEDSQVETDTIVLEEWFTEYAVDEEPPPYEPTEEDRLALVKRLRAFYVKYEPRKLTEVDRQSRQYLGLAEFDLFLSLTMQYGPEPDPPKRRTHRATTSNGALTLPTAATRTRNRARSVKLGPLVPTLHLDPIPAAGSDSNVSAVAISSHAAPENCDEDEVTLKATEYEKERLRKRLRRFYHKYDEARLAELDHLVDKYAGRDDQLMAALVAKYGGPEPPEPPTAAATSSSGGDSDQPMKTDFERRLDRFYERYDPSELPNVPGIAKRFSGPKLKENALFAALVSRHGPEPLAAEEAPDHAPYWLIVREPLPCDIPEFECCNKFRRCLVECELTRFLHHHKIRQTDLRELLVDNAETESQEEGVELENGDADDDFLLNLLDPSLEESTHLAQTLLDRYELNTETQLSKFLEERLVPRFGLRPTHSRKGFVDPPSTSSALAAKRPVVVVEEVTASGVGEEDKEVAAERNRIPDPQIVSSYSAFFTDSIKVPVDAVTLFKTVDLLDVEDVFMNSLERSFGIALSGRLRSKDEEDHFLVSPRTVRDTTDSKIDEQQQRQFSTFSVSDSRKGAGRGTPRSQTIVPRLNIASTAGSTLEEDNGSSRSLLQDSSSAADALTSRSSSFLFEELLDLTPRQRTPSSRGMKSGSGTLLPGITSGSARRLQSLKSLQVVEDEERMAREYEEYSSYSTLLSQFRNELEVLEVLNGLVTSSTPPQGSADRKQLNKRERLIADQPQEEWLSPTSTSDSVLLTRLEQKPELQQQQDEGFSQAVTPVSLTNSGALPADSGYFFSPGSTTSPFLGSRSDTLNSFLGTPQVSHTSSSHISGFDTPIINSSSALNNMTTTTTSKAGWSASRRRAARLNKGSISGGVPPEGPKMLGSALLGFLEVPPSSPPFVSGGETTSKGKKLGLHYQGKGQQNSSPAATSPLRGEGFERGYSTMSL